MDNEENESTPFSFSLKTEDPTGLLVRMLLEIRAEVDALCVLAIEQNAKLRGEDPKETAERFEKMKDDFLLQRAFSLQDPKFQPPER